MTLALGSLIEVTLEMNAYNQPMANVFTYELAAFLPTVPASQIADAWWQHFKAAYRGFANTNYVQLFRAVRVLELNNPLGDYGEYAIPSAEGTGTRGGGGDAMPSFLAAGIKLVVGTRTTRPGSKRLVGLAEADQNAGLLVGTAITTATTLANLMSAYTILGAPAIGTELQPIIVRRDITGAVIARQNVVGAIVKAEVTTQNSRKVS